MQTISDYKQKLFANETINYILISDVMRNRISDNKSDIFMTQISYRMRNLLVMALIEC